MILHCTMQCHSATLHQFSPTLHHNSLRHVVLHDIPSLEAVQPMGGGSLEAVQPIPRGVAIIWRLHTALTLTCLLTRLSALSILFKRTNPKPNSIVLFCAKLLTLNGPSKQKYQHKKYKKQLTTLLYTQCIQYTYNTQIMTPLESTYKQCVGRQNVGVPPKQRCPNVAYVRS